MGNVQRIQVGPENTPLQQGRSSHGRWRYAYQRADHTPEGAPPVHANLFIIQDADRLAFALTDGPAASLLGERLADFLWTRETASDDWPQNVRDWLDDTERWTNAPPGLTSFICGRLERNLAGGRLYLAWLGMNGLSLLDRLQAPITLDTVLSADEGWTPENGPEPVGMALHAYRGSLFGLDRMIVYTQAAAPIGSELADISAADLEQALVDWSEDCDRDLVLFDLRLNPVLTKPSTVLLSYRWTSPDMCLLSWQPTSHATGYRVEESESPNFEAPTMLAELTDGRQVQYSFSPPPNGMHYYRIVPLNQGAAGTASDPIAVVPMTLSAPALEPIHWSDEGGYSLIWSAVPQATSYEIQTSPSPNFADEETHIIFRGEATETYLPHDTPLGLYYRVRAINVLYAPHTPSHWSKHQHAPIRLSAPVFTQVTPNHISWESVPGARQYAVHVTPKGQDEQTGEVVHVIEPNIIPSDAPAVYKVQALRSPDDIRTASEWSDSVTLAPAQAEARRAALPFALPILIGGVIVALIVGGLLGVAGLESIESDRATHTPTPLSREVIEQTHTAATQNANQATAVVVLGGTKTVLQSTVQAQIDAEETRTRVPTITPSITPNMTSTIDRAFVWAQTVTAAAWTPTPTPTDTPTNTPTFTPTNTPTHTPTFTPTFTPTITPNVSATISVAVAAFMAATETARPSLTPTPLPTNTPRPSQTPNLVATVDEAVAATLTAQPTLPSTQRPSRTPDLVATVDDAVAATLTAQPTVPTLPATPNWEATIGAVKTAALPAGCFLTDPPAEPMPVLRAPVIGAATVADAAPRYSIIMGRSLSATSEVWLEVLFAMDGEAISGWVRLPGGVNETDIMNGADCPPPTIQ